MRKKGVTISDIAERTGYSKTTVSFAFNWPNRISADAVSKILECAKELGYRSNAGQIDNDNRYKCICMLIPEAAMVPCEPVWARSVMRIYSLCAEKGFMLSLIDEKRISDVHFARTCVVDAFMMFCPANMDAFFMDTMRKRRIPVIGINLEPECDTDEEKNKKRVENAAYCANLVFDLIQNKSIPEGELDKGCSFIELND